MSREWFFVSGKIVDLSNIPLVFPDFHPDSGEYILFMNPTQCDAEIKITFYFEDRDPVFDFTSLKAERVAQHPLHVKSKKVLPWNVRYGCKVESSQPIICQWTHGQWKPNDDVTEAMASTMMYPGPLGEKETRWAYADGIRCYREDHLLEESEWVCILNPGDSPAHITLKAFHSVDKEPSKWEEVVDAQRIKWIKLEDQPWVVPYELYGLMLDSDQPIIVEELRHAYERGSYITPRSMFDTIAYPGFGIDTGEKSHE